MKAWPVLGISFIEVILLLAHWFLFHTWVRFFGLGPATTSGLRIALLLLALSFIAASLLSFRFHNPIVIFIYKVAAIWLGFLNYFFWAACLTWLFWFAFRALGSSSNPASVRPLIAGVFCASALLTGIYGLVNARRIRVWRLTVTLKGLPESWRGRRALLLSDLHLGNINGVGFSRRMVALANSLQPDIIFIPGDLFDGTKANLDRLTGPFKELSPPYGVATFSNGKFTRSLAEPSTTWMR